MSGELRMKLFQKLHPKFVTVSGFKSRTGEDMGEFSAAPIKQEAQLMLTTGSTRLAVNQGQQT